MHAYDHRIEIQIMTKWVMQVIPCILFRERSPLLKVIKESTKSNKLSDSILNNKRSDTL